MKKLTIAEVRKQIPVFSGFIKYFPRAIESVAHLSFIANEQHNPGTLVHWDRTKSTDDLDAMMRHLTDHAKGIEYDDDGMLHMTKVAWRAMATLEKLLEQKNER